mmetsp:Transcript_15723/g.23669  ORF Transcript_15723/g.23669 Transcript_15723/m.23669 type:complete len:237 (+) Transcript_15723:660-1370(+)
MTKEVYDSLNIPFKTRHTDRQTINTKSSSKSLKEIKTISYTRKKKIKTQNKLMSLKKHTHASNRITFTDTKSPDTLLLVVLKNNKKNIDIPSNWKLKKKYLIGNKKKEHSKKIITSLQFDISLMKKGKVNFNQLKTLVTENNYDVKCLEFGKFYEESFEYKKYIGKFIPGILSKKLRSALGISDYSTPPWVDYLLSNNLSLYKLYTKNLLRLIKSSQTNSPKYLNNFYESSLFRYW